jgi:hypothetical protein
MRIECVVRTAGIAVPRRLEHAASDHGLVELHEQRRGAAVGMVQSIRSQLDRREMGCNLAGRRKRPSLGRGTAKDGDLRLELDRVEFLKARRPTCGRSRSTPALAAKRLRFGRNFEAIAMMLSQSADMRPTMLGARPRL